MDWFGLILSFDWLVLAAVFGWGWLRGGNGAWRWLGKDHPTNPNTPLFGAMSFVFLISFGWMLYSATYHGALGAPGRINNRLYHELPLHVLFWLIAAVRRPWRNAP